MTIAPHPPVRRALVLGASQGIGYACAEALARAGSEVAICSRDARNLEVALGKLNESGLSAMGIPADVSVESDVKRLFETLAKDLGRIDVLVTNSGGPPPGTLDDLNSEQWRSAFEMVVMPVVNAMAHVVPSMKERGWGRVIALGSSSTRSPIQNLVLSNALRPAVLGLIKAAATELAPYGVTVNMVSPGRISTARVQRLDQAAATRTGTAVEEVQKQSIGRIPAGRYGLPSEVASVVSYLASPDASYVTGQNILVDGAMVPTLP